MLNFQIVNLKSLESNYTEVLRHLFQAKKANILVMSIHKIFTPLFGYEHAEIPSYWVNCTKTAVYIFICICGLHSSSQSLYTSASLQLVG